MNANRKDRLLVPLAPALIAFPSGAVWVSADGEIESIGHREAARRARATPPLLCHLGAVAARLGAPHFPAFDLLELFAFVRPAIFCLPNVQGLAQVLDIAPLAGHEDEAVALPRLALLLLDELSHRALVGSEQERSDARAIAQSMKQAGWTWGAPVLSALGSDGQPTGTRHRIPPIWDRLPEWSESAPAGDPGTLPVGPAEARARLTQLLGPSAEQRPGQADYASVTALGFDPRDHDGVPNAVLAEAGTGIGKTLGYIAPASLWAERNKAPVWISTFTRNLQRQLDGELDRLYPDPAVKAKKVVIRKGRENYLCLLNFEDATRRLAVDGRDTAIALGLVARWALVTRGGDMIGGDLPGWLVDLLGRGPVLGLADRRGECIYSACQHYRKCFIERTQRRARKADIVIANHALVMIQIASETLDSSLLPTRLVFDEGHHVFDAADSAFSACLSGFEGAEVRRWLLGGETTSGPGSRMRGLKRRAEDLVAASQDGREALDAVMAAARILPAPGWHQRLAEGTPRGPCETVLHLIRRQVLARVGSAGERGATYAIECAPAPMIDGLAEAASALVAGLTAMLKPLTSLSTSLLVQLDDRAAELDTGTRQRIESIVRSIHRRAMLPLSAWRDMLNSLGAEPTPDFVDWFAVERAEGRDFDVGFNRHWVDPTLPFAALASEHLHGMVITSATLRDGTSDVESDWLAAERRTGAIHLPKPAIRAALASPFDYVNNTRILVVGDVRKDDLDQVGAAYRELFLAAGGGALGLFTAISRLREIRNRIAAPLDAAGIPLLAQHVDGMDTTTLVDIFRAEEDSCLLGTDAVRDGVDVPGRSLRLIVFDRVPWPRPDLLHKARRDRFGGRAYDDMLVRLRLKQAFGRLVRRQGDRGLFVLLDPMMPSRLYGAFPEGVDPRRVGLAEALAEVRGFLKAPE
jgi:ATP-dependent DNA helicase DinG